MMMSDKCSFREIRNVLQEMEKEHADRPLLADELYALKKKREQNTIR